MIICSKCGFDNEMGHIFCIRCRTKLDLSQVSEEAMMKARAPRSHKWRRLALILVCLLLVALGLACIPAELSAGGWGKADLQQARRKLAALEKGSPAPPQIFSEAEVNACLAADLNARLKVGTFKLQAIHVQLKPNAVVISALANCEPTLPGGLKPGSLDFSYRVTGVPQMGADGFSFEIARGMIGHLPLPGPLARAILPQLQAHFKELGRNYPAINAIKRLELADGQITVSSGK